MPRNPPITGNSAWSFVTAEPVPPGDCALAQSLRGGSGPDTVKRDRSSVFKNEKVNKRVS